MKKTKTKEFYDLNSILGYYGNNDVMFNVILGARGLGKTFSVQKFCLKRFVKFGNPFFWIRLNEGATKKFLANNAEKLIDPLLVKKFKLNLQTKGNEVYNVKFDKLGNVKERTLMCTVLALSTFYSDKGTAHFDKDFLKNKNFNYHIILDEFQKEKTEKSQGDISYQFVNQLENLLRDTNERVKIFLIGNTLEECSDILAKCFNFIPFKFGRYFLRRKKCVIDYVENSEDYKKRRKNSVSTLLSSESSNVTNELKMDTKLVYKGRLNKPNTIIKFSKNSNDWFTIWDDGIIARYNKENVKNIFSMRPYIDETFTPVIREFVINNFDLRNYKYKDLITFKTFQSQIQLIKPRKA